VRGWADPKPPEFWGLLVNLAAMRDPRDRDALHCVVNEIHHAPVTDSHAPLVLVPFQFLAS